MSKKRPNYPPEFRARIVALHRSGEPLKRLAEQFEPCVHTIREWVRRAEAEEARTGVPLDGDERAELLRLRRENARLLEEREILKKATAWFAREAESTPRKRSDS